jgi:hypothetical protein
MSAVGFFVSRFCISNIAPERETQPNNFSSSLIHASHHAAIIELAGALRCQERCLRLTRTELDYEIELARWCDLRLQLLSEAGGGCLYSYKRLGTGQA